MCEERFGPVREDFPLLNHKGEFLYHLVTSSLHGIPLARYRASVMTAGGYICRINLRSVPECSLRSALLLCVVGDCVEGKLRVLKHRNFNAVAVKMYVEK